MRHVDADVLALLALGEQVADPSDRHHLAECEACAAELADYVRTAEVGRSTLDAGELLQPHARVWERIAAEVATDQAPAEFEPTAGEPAAVAPKGNVTPIRRRAWIGWVAAGAAALVVVGVVLTQVLAPAPSTVLAAAELEAFPDWPGASGTAVVEREGDGTRVIRVSFDAPGDEDGFHEVWLITSDATRLVSLGVVQGTTGTFVIPNGIDLAEYDLVDISAEPYDGDPAHSGDSIVRGQLS
jgi:hypothetical protein